MTHEQIEDAIPLYALGALEPRESEEVESHLRGGCPTCQSLEQDYRRIAGMLPAALPPLAPPSKAKILAAARAGKKAAGPRARLPWSSTQSSAQYRWRAAVGQAVMSLIVLAGAALFAWNAHQERLTANTERAALQGALQETKDELSDLRQQLTQKDQALAELRSVVTRRLETIGEAQSRLIEREAEVEVLRRQLSRHEREVRSLRQAVAERDEMLTFLKSTQVRVVPLSGLDQAKGSGAFLLYDPESQKAFFYAFNMPPLPAGKTYQLWAIVDQPHSMGIFHTDKGQKGRLLIPALPDFPRVTKFAVSIEPEGGRVQPTGSIYLAGQV